MKQKHNPLALWIAVTVAILFALPLVAATVTPGSDLTSGDYGPMSLDSNFKGHCSQAAPGAILQLPGIDGGVPLDPCSTVSLTTDDLGALPATASLCSAGGLSMVTTATGTTTTTSTAATATGTISGTFTATTSITSLATVTLSATSLYTRTFTTTDTWASATYSGSYLVQLQNYGTPTSTSTATATGTGTGTMTGTATGTASLTGTVTTTPTATATNTAFAQVDPLQTVTLTLDKTATGAGTASETFAFTGTLTGTAIQTSTAVTGTASGTATASASSLQTSTETATHTVTNTSTSSCASVASQPTITGPGGTVGCHGTCSTNYLQEWDGTGLTDGLFSRAGTVESFAGTAIQPSTNGGANVGAADHRFNYAYFRTLMSVVDGTGNSVTLTGGNIGASGGVSVSGTVSGSNITYDGDTIGTAAGNLKKPAAPCNSDQCIQATASDGTTICFTPSGTGTGITCSGTCSASSWAVFADSTHVSNAPYTPMNSNAIPGSQSGWLHDNGAGTRIWSTPTAAETGATPDNHSITAQGSAVAVTYDNRGRVTGAQTITPSWIGAVATSAVASFGGVYTNSNPGYFETNSTTWVDVYTSSLATPAGYLNVQVAASAAFSGSGSTCYMRMVLDSTAVGNSTRTQAMIGTHAMVAGHVSVSAATHTLHVQMQSESSLTWCRVYSGELGFAATVGPS